MERPNEVKRIWRSLPLLSFPLFWASFAMAQSSVDINLGLGSFHNSATGLGLDNAASPNAFGACSLSSGDTFCQATPGMGSVFLGFGGDVMFYKHFGAGFSANVQPVMQNYGPLKYRQTFYDVNAIYAPLSVRRASLRIEGGLGAARTSFAVSQTACAGTAVCTSSTQPIGSSGHFDVHTGIGVQFFLTDHIFIRPQFDFHYVPGLTNQFGSNAVPGGTIWVGYNFGER